MMIPRKSVAPFDFEGLEIRDFTHGRDVNSSLAEITVPVGARHRTSWSERSDKYYFGLAGKLEFEIEDRRFQLAAGDLCIIHKGCRFSYENGSTAVARVLLVHTPSFDISSEVFENAHIRGTEAKRPRAGLPEEEGMKIEYLPIGFVRSPHQTTRGVPIQPSRARGIKGTVELEERYAEGLADLDGFSHIILICHLHKAADFKLKVVPYLDTELRGLFATRAPSRPNPIGLSVVRLHAIDGNILSIEGVDLLDGTPVLDIKPYVGDFDKEIEVRCGWLDQVKDRETVADERFEK